MNHVIAILLGLNAHQAFAAVEVKADQCRHTRVITSAQEVENAVPGEIQWNCVNLSRLAKGDLLKVAAKAPSMNIAMSEAKVSWVDLVEAQGRTKVSVLVDSRRLNKREIMAMQDAGIGVTIKTFGLLMSSRDYTEIAQNGPVSIEVNSKVFSKQNLIDLGKMENAKLSIEPRASGMSPADIAEIVASMPKETEAPATGAPSETK